MRKKKPIKLGVAVAVAAITLNGCGQKVSQTADFMEVELGSEVVKVEINDFFTGVDSSRSEVEVDYSEVNTDKIGTYNVFVTINGEKFIIHTAVVDTVSPTLKPVGGIPSFTADDTIHAADFVTVEDSSKCEIYFVVDGEDKESIVVTEDTTVEIVAVDEAGNRSETLRLGIKVKEGVKVDFTGSYIDDKGVVHLSEEALGYIINDYGAFIGEEILGNEVAMNTLLKIIFCNPNDNSPLTVVVYGMIEKTVDEPFSKARVDEVLGGLSDWTGNLYGYLLTALPPEDLGITYDEPVGQPKPVANKPSNSGGQQQTQVQAQQPTEPEPPSYDGEPSDEDFLASGCPFGGVCPNINEASCASLTLHG